MIMIMMMMMMMMMMIMIIIITVIRRSMHPSAKEAMGNDVKIIRK